MFEHPRSGRGGSRRRRTFVVVLGVIAWGLAGCGDETDTSGDVARACQADLEVTTNTLAMFAEIPETGPTASTESVNTTRRLFQANVERPLRAFTDNVPAAIADEAKVLAAGYRQFGRTADDTVLGSESFEEAGAAVDAYLFENCRQTKHTVTATDYRFDGLPQSLAAGGFRLRLENKGKENHEIAVLARAEGVDQSWDSLLGLPLEELLPMMRIVAVDDSDPGKQAYASGLLEPGEYLVACFVPQGTPSGAEERGSGTPHHELGMRQILIVK